MLLWLLACTSDECRPVSETPIDPGGSEETRQVLEQALADFVAWSGRDVCVSEISVHAEWDPDALTVEVEDDPYQARTQAFYDLCWLADPDASFALDHPMAFSGRAIAEEPHARAVREDFARSCADASSYLPWVEVALASCEAPSARAEALTAFFDQPGAGFPHEPVQMERLGTVPVADSYDTAVAGDRLLIGTSTWEADTLWTFALPSLEPRESYRLPPANRWVVRGYTTALWVSRETGEVFEVRDEGLVPGAPLPKNIVELAQDADSWWAIDSEGALYRYDLQGGIQRFDAGRHRIASGETLRIARHDGTGWTGDLADTWAQAPGYTFFVGGRSFSYADVWPHRVFFGLSDAGPVIVDTWCNGAQEWIQPQRVFVGSRDWLLDLRFVRPSWFGAYGETEVFLVSP